MRVNSYDEPARSERLSFSLKAKPSRCGKAFKSGCGTEMTAGLLRHLAFAGLRTRSRAAAGDGIFGTFR
jgi:hypothetical protein